MKRRFLCCLLLLAFFLATAVISRPDEDSSKGKGTGQSPLDRFSPEQREKLERGEAVFEYVLDDSDDSMKGYGRTSILVKKPVDECFRIFLDFEKQRFYLPRMRVSRVIGKEGNTVRIYKELDYTLVTVKYTHILTIHEAEHRVDFQDARDEYKPENRKGFFEFIKVDDRTTLFTYSLLRLDTGFPVPETAKKYVTSKDLPGIAEAVRKRIESGGVWEK